MSGQRKDYRRPPGRPFKSGSRALARFVREQRLDRRTWLSHFVEQTETMLADDAGGAEQLTNRETLMVNVAATLWTEYQLMVWQRQQGILRGQPDHESDKYFLAHVNALRRTLETLGLKPDRADKLPSLSEYIAARSNGTPDGATAAQGDDPNEARAQAGEPEAAAGGEDADNIRAEGVA